MRGALCSLGEGEGRPVLFLPGLQGDAVVFRPLLGRIAKSRPVWGFSFGDQGLKQDVRDLSAVIEQSGLSGADVICGSYGGQVALRSEKSWASVVLTGSFPSYESLSFQAKARLRASLAMPVSLLGRLYARTFEARLLEDGLPPALASDMRSPGGGALQARLRGLLALQSVSVSVPLLWLAGEDDEQSPWSEKQIRQTWPHATVERLTGKHRPYASHPEEFSRLVEGWWASINPCK